jgi:hypothetical protein
MRVAGRPLPGRRPDRRLRVAMTPSGVASVAWAGLSSSPDEFLL